MIIGSTFASVHNFAVATSLYWYYPWFDVLMHFWGGVLVALGVAALSAFRFIRLQPTLWVTLAALTFAMISWEIFERTVGYLEPATYLFDTAKDLLMGFSGGIVGYVLLKHFRKM